jgi:acetyl esterase/lipase
MALDRHARRFLDLTNASAKSRGEPTLEEMRRGVEDLAGFAGSRRGPQGEARDAILPGDEIAVRIYSPFAPSHEMLPGLVYFHGGGWLSGGLASHEPICRALAEQSGCRVVAVHYRLAPEHRFPAGLEDCRSAVSILSAQANRFGLDPARIGVAGDSAGGNLAVAVCQWTKQNGPPIALQALLCPVMDALGHTPSRRTLGEGHFLEERTLVRYWENYRIEGLDPDDPRVSPLRGDDFADLPPAIIHTAEYDPLCDEGALYAVRLAEAGVKVRHVQHPGMIHHFYGLGGAIPYAATALAQIGAEIREALA